MKVLVINNGSSSIKFQLVDTQTKHSIASGLVERIGEAMGKIKYEGKEKVSLEMHFADHREGLMEVAKLLTDKKVGVIADANEIRACGHRTVHGGEEFNHSVLVTNDVLAALKRCIPLAPLHNPANIIGIEVASSIFPNAKHVCVFDTAFHQTMPAKAYRYAIPNHFYTEDGIRKYGFHGTSHLYVSRRAAEMLGKNVEDVNLITVHVGNGGSVTAVKGGKSIDTTMGMTPLAGLVMGTRSGDIDPAIPYFLYTNKGLSMKEIDNILNKESGMKGLTGTGDLRDVSEKYLKGDPACTLAMEMYTYRIKKTIGSYCAALGHVDGIVFTAGVGENSDLVRELVCSKMNFFGIKLDPEHNKERSHEERFICTPDSSVKVMVIPTNEELEIANQTAEVLEK